MLLSNVSNFAGVFRGSMVFWSDPSGSLALRWRRLRRRQRRVELSKAQLNSPLGNFYEETLLEILLCMSILRKR